MSKIGLIVRREYLSRVKKKSFLVMTILGPLLMAGIIVARIWLESMPEEKQKVLVIDETTVFEDELKNYKNIEFEFSKQSLELAKKEFYKTEHNIILYIPVNIVSANAIQILYKKQPGLNTQEYIKNSIETKIENWKLLKSGIDKETLDKTKVTIAVQTAKIEESGDQKKSYTEVSIILGFVAGFLIYIFIFMYGAMVMRGVIEEKTSRIIEVIITSVTPFQLMMGKIMGIALVGLTQFILWIILTTGLTSISTSFVAQKMYDSAEIKKEQTFSSNMPINAQQEIIKKTPDAVKEMYEMVDSINLPVMIFSFLIYFIGGYLLYGALFAAIGAAVDSEADTQQFMVPITIPLVLAFIVAQVIITNPESKMAFWFSMFPLTSPIVMMVRIPFGVPIWEIALSMGLLVVGFIFTTWLAAKIYRVGILMYGKKPSYKELWKWIFYKA
ncbi:MAG: ABC transporter permease [Bacteroidota bacterium]